MSVTAIATFGIVEDCHGVPLCLFVRSNHQLGDAFAISDLEGDVAEIDEQHTNFATVVGIDGAWCVEHGDTMFESEAGAWAHLSLVACRECDM